MDFQLIDFELRRLAFSHLVGQRFTHAADLGMGGIDTSIFPINDGLGLANHDRQMSIMSLC